MGAGVGDGVGPGVGAGDGEDPHASDASIFMKVKLSQFCFKKYGRVEVF